ncbi:hypothetical protein, partial [Staphylococcus aureus]
MGYRKYAPGTQPSHLHAPYVSSQKRAPLQALIAIPATPSDLSGPSFSSELVTAHAFDLTKQHHAAPLGERIVVSGRVL